MNAPPTTRINPDAAAFARLKTRAARAGHTAMRDAPGWVTLSRWGRTVSFDDVGTAAAWLDRVIGGATPPPGSAEG